ncbi:MAG: hypothetical protein AB8B66_05005 [Rickettsiaceae bacterium]
MKGNNNYGQEEKKQNANIIGAAEVQLQNNVPALDFDSDSENTTPEELVKVHMKYLYDIFTTQDANQQQELAATVQLIHDTYQEELLQMKNDGILDENEYTFTPNILSHIYEPNLADGTPVAPNHQNQNGFTIAHSLGLHEVCNAFGDLYRLECNGQVLTDMDAVNADI